MSRSETLRLIAVFTIVILIGCLLAFCLIQYGNTLSSANSTTSPSPLSWIPEKDGLSIVSHGVEMSAENDTAVIELIEQFVEGNYGNYYALTSINTRDAVLHGVALAIQYPEPRELLWEDYGRGYLVVTPVQVHRIVVLSRNMNGCNSLANLFIYYPADRISCKSISVRQPLHRFICRSVIHTTRERDLRVMIQ